jgi:uncharacterized protein (TIGR00369 family)
MSGLPDTDPATRARGATEFFGPLVPGQLGCVFELKANFLSSARVGERVACRCTPAHLGRQTHVWDATVTNETTGRTMALFRCTQMVLSAK